MTYSVTLLPLYDTARSDARLCAEPRGLLSQLQNVHDLYREQRTPLPNWLQYNLSRGGVMIDCFKIHWWFRKNEPHRAICPHCWRQL